MAAFDFAPTTRSASPSVGHAGGGAVREGEGEGGRATERGRKNAPITVTCLACGHGPQGHNDEHKAQWLREVV